MSDLGILNHVYINWFVNYFCDEMHSTSPRGHTSELPTSLTGQEWDPPAAYVVTSGDLEIGSVSTLTCSYLVPMSTHAQPNSRRQTSGLRRTADTESGEVCRNRFRRTRTTTAGQPAAAVARKALPAGAAPRFWKWGTNSASEASRKLFWSPLFGQWGQNIA